jgi:hypothetical protein
VTILDLINALNAISLTEDQRLQFFGLGMLLLFSFVYTVVAIRSRKW